MKIGDYIRQENTDSTALIFEKLKNGSFKAYVHDYRGRIVIKSIRGWYPIPEIISKEDIPDKIMAKFNKYLSQN